MKSRTSTIQTLADDLTPDTIRQLCTGGDWACAHGDLGALRHVAQHLAAGAAEPLHRELLDLAELCLQDPYRAPTLWGHLTAQLSQAAAPARLDRPAR